MYSLNGIPFKKKIVFERTDGQTDGRTVRLYYAPNFIWGHKNQFTGTGAEPENNRIKRQFNNVQYCK